MRVNRYVMPLVSVVALLGTVLVAKAWGVWQTSGRDMIDPSKPMTAADIRGWMSLEYVSEGFGIPLDELRVLLGVPPSTPPGTPLKDLEGTIEVSEVRTVIGEYVGEFSPQSGEPSEAEPTATLADVGAEHGPDTGGGTGTGPTPLPPGQILPAAEIKGRMTLQEVSEQCGVPLPALLEALGLPEDTASNKALRDLVSQTEGFEVSRVREVVAELQAR